MSQCLKNAKNRDNNKAQIIKKDLQERKRCAISIINTTEAILHYHVKTILHSQYTLNTWNANRNLNLTTNIKIIGDTNTKYGNQM